MEIGRVQRIQDLDFRRGWVAASMAASRSFEVL